jgi:hypothetical protein
MSEPKTPGLIPRSARSARLKTPDLILRSARSARLEGWMHGTDSRPSFETRAQARAPQDEAAKICYNAETGADGRPAPGELP